MRSLFPGVGKAVALAVLAAPAVVLQAWRRIWEYIAGLSGPSRFASPWTVLESSLSPALISAMS